MKEGEKMRRGWGRNKQALLANISRNDSRIKILKSPYFGIIRLMYNIFEKYKKGVQKMLKGKETFYMAK